MDGRTLGPQFERCADDALDGDAAKAAVMAHRTCASITIATRHVVEQHTMWNLPRRVLWIRESVKVDDRRADRSGEIDVPLHFMPHTLMRLSFADPFSQQVIGILATVSKPKRNAGQKTKHRCWQRALAVDGKNNRGVELTSRNIVA